MDKKSFGSRLKDAIDNKMLTHAKFAEQVGVDPKTVGGWVRDKHYPQKRFHKIICEVLERKPEELDFIEELDIVKEEGMARGRRDKELRFDEAGELPVGARMRVARKNKGISLTAMTEKTAGEERPGYSVSYLSTVENGGAPPSFKLAEMYERILGLEKGELTQMLEKERKTPKQVQEPADRSIEQGGTEKEDWGEMPIVANFYGRLLEIADLEQWVVTNRQQVVAILGLGGIGKTALATSLAEKVKHNFDRIFWRSLRNTPSVESFLSECIQFLSGSENVDIPRGLNDQISTLMKYVKKYRCLIVLDNLESVLGSHSQRTEYGEVLQRVGESRHQSCFLLTSREKPEALAALEAKAMPVRSLQLIGLPPADAWKIIEEKELIGTDEERRRLITFYAGNPLAIRLVAEFIREVFRGSISAFWEAGEPIFEDIHDLLKQQFERLSPLEAEIMYWIAIGQEEASLDDVQEDMIHTVAKGEPLEAIRSLQRRFLLEKRGSKQFLLHPVIMEYVIDQFVELVCEEIATQTFGLFKSHALIKAQSKEFARNSQVNLILKPIADRLLKNLGKEEAERRLKGFITLLREEPQQDYMAGNTLNLLIQMTADLRDADFSHLTVRQAYLQRVTLPGVNFAYTDLSKSVFTDTFGSILSLALSPGEAYLAAGTASAAIQFWYTASSEPFHTCLGHVNWVRSVAFSPNGNVLASGSDDSTIRLWETKTGYNIGTLEEHNDRVRTVSFSPDGRLLASSSDDRQILLWDVSTWRCLSRLRGHTERVRTIAFSPNGSLLASGSDDRQILLWDVKSGQSIRELRGHIHWVRVVVFSPDGRLLATGSDDKTIRLWDAASGEYIKTLSGHTNIVRTLAFHPKGSILASGSEDHTIRFWQINDGHCYKILQGHSNAVRALLFNHKGDMLISGGDDQTIRFWSTDGGQCLKTLQGHSTWIYSVTFSPDGKLLASGGQDHQVRIWEASSGRRLKDLQGHHGLVYSVAFSPDGKLLVSGSQDHQVRVWEVSSGRCLIVLRGHSNQVNSVVFNPDGRLLASGSEDNTVCIWEVSSEQKLLTLEGHSNRVRSVAFSPDGQLLASGSEDTTIHIWAVSSGRSLNVLKGHTDQVRSVVFSPDGQLLASGSEDNMIRIWEVSSGSCLSILKEHSNRVRSVAFSPDGQLLASGSEDSIIRVWQVSNGDCLKTLRGHHGLIYSVAFDTTGQTLASGSYDGTIKLWNIQTEECLQVLESEKPYEGMNIMGTTGLTNNQKNVLRTLGAIEE